MNLNIRFSTQVEQRLRVLAEHQGKSIEHIVEELVAEQLSERDPPPMEPEPFKLVERLRSWTRLHPQIETPIDDRRAAIYED